MKTSVIEVHDMLSVLSVDGVGRLIGEVPGVESVTVNFAAGSATVRYDETRLKAADIKVAVHQKANESPSEPVSKHKASQKDAAPPTPAVGAASKPGTVSAKPEPVPVTVANNASKDNPAASATDESKDKLPPDSPSSAPASSAPKAGPVTPPSSAPAPEHTGHSAPQ